MPFSLAPGTCLAPLTQLQLVKIKCMKVELEAEVKVEADGLYVEAGTEAKKRSPVLTF